MIGSCWRLRRSSWWARRSTRPRRSCPNREQQRQYRQVVPGVGRRRLRLVRQPLPRSQAAPSHPRRVIAAPARPTHQSRARRARPSRGRTRPAPDRVGRAPERTRRCRRRVGTARRALRGQCTTLARAAAPDALGAAYDASMATIQAELDAPPQPVPRSNGSTAPARRRDGNPAAPPRLWCP